MNIKVNGKGYRLKGRFFMLCYILILIILCTTMTLDFEQRWNKPHGEFFVPVSEVSFVNYHRPLGEYTITFYCPCAKCCGKADGVTTAGTVAAEGRTVAVNLHGDIPLGSTLIIDGHEYIVEDNCGIPGRVDIFVDSHQDALSRGKYTREVFKE